MPNRFGGGGGKRRRANFKQLKKKADGGIVAMIHIRTLGDALRFFRFQRNISQIELGQLILERTGNSVGVQTISDIENGRHDARWSTVCTIADALGVKTDDLRIDSPSQRLSERIAEPEST